MHHRSTPFVAVLLAVALASAARPSFAVVPIRAEAPDLVGVVRDSAGAPLHDAQIIVAEVGRTVSTDADGEFRVRGLPAGTYHLNVIAIGYAPEHVTVVLPQAGDVVRVTITMRPTSLQLGGVVVTASPTGTDPLAVTQATVELSGKALARNLGASVAQTLSNEPGMSVRYNGPAASMPVIRGLTGERILVLQDGDRAGDLSAASADHGLSVDPITAQRVEVVRGPASLLYGNNALGGVVNVISNDIPTEVPNHLEGYVGGQTESVSPGGAMAASLTQPLGERFALTLRGNFRDVGTVHTGGGGRLDNTDARAMGGAASLGFVGSRVTAGASYRGGTFEYGVPSPPDADESGIRLDGFRHQATARATIDMRSARVPLLRVDGTAQWYGHDEIEPDGAIGTTFELQTQTLNATAKTQFARWTGAFGAQGLFKQYAATGEEALTPGAHSASGGMFVYQDVPLGAPREEESRTPRLQMGARFDRFRIASEDSEDAKFGPGQTRTFDNVSGSLGLSFPIGGSATLSGSVARAFRAPTVEELFSNAFHAATGAYEVGDPTLQAETNAGVDGVLRVQSGRTTVQLSAYYNRVNDYIAITPRGDTLTDEGLVPLAFYEQSDATLRGLEGQVEAQVTKAIVLGAMGDVLRGRFTDERPLPFMPAGRLGASARWEAGRWSVEGDVRHTFAQDDVLPNEYATDAYTLANLSASYTIVLRSAAHTFTLRAQNLGDVEYRDATSRIKAYAPNPGRNISLVYRVLF